MGESTTPEVFLKKGVLEICSKFTGDHPCRSVISIKLRSNCKFAVTVNTSGELLLNGLSSHYHISIKGATKLYFMHYLCVVIILLNVDLCESAFSNYYFKFSNYYFKKSSSSSFCVLYFLG